jgi:chorismate lyase/3-hydroxybenzoate synthase
VVGEHLRVVLANTISPPTIHHELLVAFRFGPEPAGENHPAIADTHLNPVAHDCLYECWWIAQPVSYRREGKLRIAECEDYAVVIQDNAETAEDDLESLTRIAYLELVSAIRSTQHKQLLKAWNYLGGINDGDGDFERYRRFSVGRARAFKELGIGDAEAPTGTGVGTAGNLGLTIIALASRHRLQLAENPRQVSAFDYPRQYGPSSPKFSRSGFTTNATHTLYLLSGTAAIVGHESLHPYAVGAQVDETLRNLAALSDSVAMLEDGSVLRVYLREPSDLGEVREKLQARLAGRGVEMVFVQGNICRRELVIEIDGVRVL